VKFQDSLYAKDVIVETMNEIAIEAHSALHPDYIPSSSGLKIDDSNHFQLPTTSAMVYVLRITL